MVEVKDSGREFHWSRPRIVGLAFATLASPIFFAFASFGHEHWGFALWLATCAALTIAYVRRTPVRKFIQRLIPTTAEKAERLRMDPDA